MEKIIIVKVKEKDSNKMYERVVYDGIGICLKKSIFLIKGEWLRYAFSEGEMSDMEIIKEIDLNDLL